MSEDRERAVSLFQRIKTPFIESEQADEAPPPRRTRAVGELLRARREQLELDLDTVGEQLRIRPAYLAALEQGRIEDLPGPAYALGFVRAYANHLGLDGDRVLARYKADTADVHARPDLSLPVPLAERSLPGGPIVLVALILALCGYGTWYYLSTGERSRPERVAAVPAELKPAPAPSPATSPGATPKPTSPGAEPEATASSKPGPPPAPSPEPRQVADAPPPDSPPPGPAASLVPTVPAPALSGGRPGATGAPDPIVFPGSSPVPPGGASAQPPAAPPSTTAFAVAPPSSSAQPTATAPAPGTPGGDRRVAIRALADCWIQVRTSDQTVVFSRVLKAGEIYHVPGRSGLSLRTGNAGALAIEVDGKTAPSIGPIGTLRRNVALDPEALVAGTAVQG
jgi:cytoskeleton protein RodZ